MPFAHLTLALALAVAVTPTLVVILWPPPHTQQEKEQQSKLHAMVWQGIPMSLKRDVYMLTTKVEDLMTGSPVGYYTELITR